MVTKKIISFTWKSQQMERTFQISCLSLFHSWPRQVQLYRVRIINPTWIYYHFYFSQSTILFGWWHLGCGAGLLGERGGVCLKHSPALPFRRYGLPLYSSFGWSGMCWMKSPGWQFKTVQILSITSMGRCFAVPVQIAEIVGGLIPVFSANCFWFMSFIANNTFNRNFTIHITPFFTLNYSRIIQKIQYEKRNTISTLENKFLK